MKRYIIFILVLCCLLSGCGVKTQEAAPLPTVEPQTTAQAEPTAEPGPMQLLPLPQAMDTLNGRLSVSLGEGAVYVNENNFPEMKVTVHAYELYDAVEINALKVGDSVLRLGEELVISSLERAENGDIIINGGLDVGGHVFRPGDGGTYYEISYNDARAFNAVGELVLPVADEFYFVDKSDLDREPQTYHLDSFFVDGLFGWYFFPSNTTIQLENGVVVSMERVYIP